LRYPRSRDEAVLWLRPTDAECGHNPLHVAAWIATAVASAFVLLMAAAGIAQAAAAKHDAGRVALAARLATAMRSTVLP